VADSASSRDGFIGVHRDAGEVDPRNDRREHLRQRLQDFIDACNFARRLETIEGLATCEYICSCWTSQSDRFIIHPIHQMPGLNTWAD